MDVNHHGQNKNRYVSSEKRKSILRMPGSRPLLHQGSSMSSGFTINKSGKIKYNIIWYNYTGISING